MQVRAGAIWDQALDESAVCVSRPRKSFLVFSTGGATGEARRAMEHSGGFTLVGLDDLYA